MHIDESYGGVLMNLVYALAAYPTGMLSDQIGRGGLLAVGMVCLVVADIILALGMTITLVMIGVIFWGFHMALTQGLFSSLVADTAPEDLRGTAFWRVQLRRRHRHARRERPCWGLWDAFSPAATFLAGAAFAAVALISLVLAEVWGGNTSLIPGKDQTVA